MGDRQEGRLAESGVAVVHMHGVKERSLLKKRRPSTEVLVFLSWLACNFHDDVRSMEQEDYLSVSTDPFKPA